MPTPSELRARLENEGEELQQITKRIENRIQDYRDWRSLVRRHPLSSVGIAFGVGLFLSGSSLPLLALIYQQLRTQATRSALSYFNVDAHRL